MIYGLDSAVTESQNNKLNIIKCISFIDESQQACKRVPSTPALVREALTESGGLQLTSLLLSRTLTAVTPVVGHIPSQPFHNASLSSQGTACPPRAIWPWQGPCTMQPLLPERTHKRLFFHEARTKQKLIKYTREQKLLRMLQPFMNKRYIQK